MSAAPQPKACDHSDPCSCDLALAIERAKASGDKEQEAAARVAKATDRVSATDAQSDSKRFRLPSPKRSG